MMPPATRPPLPSKSIPDAIVGNDTRAQAIENQRRIAEYLDFLDTNKKALPADRNRPNRLSTAQVAQEAGVSLGVLRPGHALRVKVEEAIPILGLAVIHVPPARDRMTVGQCHDLFRSLAPAEAKKLGFKSEAMTKFVDELFELIRRRAKDGNDAPDQTSIDALRKDAEEKLLDLPDQVLHIIENFHDWVAQSADLGASFTQEALTAMSFHDLLSLGMENFGLSQSQAAEIAGIPQPALHKWLHENRFPNRRNFQGLRRLAEHFGFPSEALIASITRSHGGSGYHFRQDDFPPEYRGKGSKRVRDAVKSRLTDEDFQLSSEAFRSRISSLCSDISGAFEGDRARKRMRDANRIARESFPEALVEQLTEYIDDLNARGRAKATQTSYCNHLEGFFNFALSSNAPPDLRLKPETVSLLHAGSRALWEAYFTHLTDIGRAIMGAKFCISRAIVDRMTAVAAMFAEDGFIDRHPTFLSNLQALTVVHCPKRTTQLWADLSADQKLEAVHLDLQKFRKTWIKGRSQAPVNGRSQIADLLAMDNPLEAVTQILKYLRDRKAKLRKWETGQEGKRLNYHYATALRKIVLVHFLGQTALRVGMVPLITVGKSNCHLRWAAGGKPELTIPAELFKNGTSEVFKTGPYHRKLTDRDGFYADLDEYLKLARPRFLDGKDDNHLFLTRSYKEGGQPVSDQVTRHEIAEFTAEAIGINAPAGRRLIKINHLRPHHFRDILATAVLRKSNRNFALAGDAIHVTEETARQYYAYDTVEQRRPDLDAILENL